MTNMHLDDLVSIIGVVGMSAMILGFIVLRLTLTRRLKKKLMATGDYWDSGTVDFGLINTTIFAWACTMPWFQKLKKFQQLYPGLDVRSFANWFERTAAYGIIYGTMLIFLSIPFFYLFKEY